MSEQLSVNGVADILVRAGEILYLKVRVDLETVGLISTAHIITGVVPSYPFNYTN